jgi:hypothetical protein
MGSRWLDADEDADYDARLARQLEFAGKEVSAPWKEHFAA